MHMWSWPISYRSKTSVQAQRIQRIHQILCACVRVAMQLNRCGSAKKKCTTELPSESFWLFRFHVIQPAWKRVSACNQIGKLLLILKLDVLWSAAAANLSMHGRSKVELISRMCSEEGWTSYAAAEVLTSQLNVCCIQPVTRGTSCGVRNNGGRFNTPYSQCVFCCFFWNNMSLISHRGRQKQASHF